MISRRKPCSRCQQKTVGKPANGYVSWYVGEDDRVSYYTSWCLTCFAEDILPFVQKELAMDGSSDTTCVIDDVEPDYRAETFLTLYLPKQEQKDYGFITCEGQCTETIRDFARGGRFQPNRNVRVGAEVSAPTQDASWASLSL